MSISALTVVTLLVQTATTGRASWLLFALAAFGAVGLIPSPDPVTGDPRMAYLNRTITLRFDGVQVLIGVPQTDDQGKEIRDEAGNLKLEVLPDLGEDVWVTIRNPMLMPQVMLTPHTDVELKPDGRTPVDRDAALRAGAEVVAGLVIDWNLTDALDYSDDPPILPLPATADMFRSQIPFAVGDAIASLIGRARNPR